MIRQDYISDSFTVLALVLLIFLSTFGTDILTRSVFVATIIFASYIMSKRMKLESEDEDIQEHEGRSIMIWASISFIAILILNLFVPRLPLGIVQSLQTVSVASQKTVELELGLLIAVAEEQFFRAFMTSFLLSKLGIVGVPLSGVFFGVYHFAVYGSQFDNLTIVIVSGIVLSYAAYRTRRVSTTIIPHAANNLLAMM